ncbi:MAG: S8 family serine peptidase [Balneolaceae bacterium]
MVKKQLTGYGEVEYVEGELIIRYKDDRILNGESRLGGDFGTRLQSLNRYRDSPSERVRLMNMSVEEGLERYRTHPDVEYVEPNFVYRIIEPVRHSSDAVPGLMQENGEGTIPDDPIFELQWGLRNDGEDFDVVSGDNRRVVSKTEGADIRAHLAWDLTTGSGDVIIAMLDSGIDYNHEDLQDNVFRDDQGNFGIDTSPGTHSPDDPLDEGENSGHGTHVAGIIGAAGNNQTGVAGINWTTRLMAVKIFNENGETSISAILRGMEYALENGATISNHSYGGTGFSQTLFNVFQEARDQGHLVVAAAGNDENNNDETPFYPAGYDLDNIISVAATNPDDQLANFSNFGATTVHIAAPGELIASTFSGNQYAYLSGTSMAAPYVVGVAGLIKAQYPDADYREIRNRILGRADALESLDGRVQNGRRLNARNALLDVAPNAVDDLEILASGQHFVSAEWTAVGFNGHGGTMHGYDFRISENPITEGNFNQADRVDVVIVPQFTGERQEVIVSNLQADQKYYLAVKAEDGIGNQSGLSNVIQFSTSAPPSKQVTGDFNQDGRLEVTMNAGEKSIRSLRIVNNGPGPLQVQTSDQFRPISLLDDEPRSFPYLFSSSRVEGAPSFQWEDISGKGNSVGFQNTVNGAESVDLPFEFPYFNEMKETVNVSVNGFLSFLPVTNPEQSGNQREIPFTANPNDLIAVHWTDFELGNEGGVYTWHDRDNERFIIQWERLRKFPASLHPDQAYTFQVILYKGGAVQMQYLQTNPENQEVSIGLEDRVGVNGALYAANQTIAEEFSITFLPGQPDWLEIKEVDFSLDTGESETIGIPLNAGALVPGRYYTEIFLLDNDLDADPTRIPVTLNVEGESAFVQFIHASVDPALSELDVFINKKLVRHGIDFNFRTELIEVPAGIDLLASVITEASSNVDDAIAEQTIRFEPDRQYWALATGMSENSQPSNSKGFEFFVHEFMEEEVEEDQVRYLFFNAVADVSSIGLIGFYPEDRPPVVLKENLPFGQLSEAVSVHPLNFELDVVEGPELFDTFKFNNGRREGQTVLSVITGQAAAGPGNPELTVINSHEVGLGSLPNKVTSPGSVARHIPEELDVEQNYPNPFNPTTQIQFSLPENREVRLVIYDILGRAVRTLVDKNLSAGIHNVTFNGSSLSSGVYFYQIRAGSDVLTRKMVLVK